MNANGFTIEVGDRVLFQGIGTDEKGREFILGSALMREVTHVSRHEDGVIIRGKGSLSLATIDIYSDKPMTDGEIHDATEVLRWKGEVQFATSPCARVRVTAQ